MTDLGIYPDLYTDMGNFANFPFLKNRCKRKKCHFTKNEQIFEKINKFFNKIKNFF